MLWGSYYKRVEGHDRTGDVERDLISCHKADVDMLTREKAKAQHETDSRMMTTSFLAANVEPIAVVGMACRFPGDAFNIEGFWKLLYNGKTAWSEVPKERFNTKAFWHPDCNHNGTFHTNGGHFLKENISVFDASFFGINQSEARAMDPQLRLLLEVAYESVENAGWTLDDLKGSSTSVYTALYNRDYEKMLLRDSENLPFYTVTGNGEAMFSNRLSYFFDLRGPSLTLDTGCSGSLVALQNACQSIWTGQADQSLVGGSNLILDPAPMMGPSFLQFYSADGRSRAFDNQAAGYGRGEGVACMILKRISDAVRDGDPIQALIRSAAVNQDGRTNGITAPSAEAQEALIRKTYAMANLDFDRTVYVEAHGSGTSLGDSVESTVLDGVFGESCQRTERPLMLGSVKTNIGHLENASGMAAVVKAVLVIKHGCIPPSLHFEQPPTNSVLVKGRVRVVTERQDLGDLGSSQISINSFGYGGTNAHIVIDAPFQRPNSMRPTNTRRYLFVLSARSKMSGQKMASQLQTYLCSHSDAESESFLDSLAFTLGQRRTAFPWRGTMTADSLAELRKLDLQCLQFKHAPPSLPKVAFVFSGQGSHWHAMGRELLYHNSIFRTSILRAEQCLSRLGAEWLLTEELNAPLESSRLGNAFISQPACTAIQLALVDLLASWSIKPSAVTGHSSGEIAAAYACRAISFESAIHASYARGKAAHLLAEDVSTKGAMIAAGLNRKDAEDCISEMPSSLSKLVRVACINSPSSVTISGDAAAIEHLHCLFEGRKVFVRRLPVKVAYHSHHMLRIASNYRDALADIPNPVDNDIPFVSSVEGKAISNTALTADYWVKNLTAPVLFADSMSNLYRQLATQHGGNGIVAIVEIGPHASLKGPITQILAEPSIRAEGYLYTSPLIRNKSAVATALTCAGDLFQSGASINLDTVNFSNVNERPECLTSLPSYPWDHSMPYWHESTLSRNYRLREHPPHPLLGVLAPDTSAVEMRWRKYIRLPEMAWLSDHKVEGRITFPGAGFLCMALDAAIFYHEMTTNKANCGWSAIRLSNVEFNQALVIPPDADNVEMMFSLRAPLPGRGRDLAGRHEFFITSQRADNAVVVNCRGFLCIETPDYVFHLPSKSQRKEGLGNAMDPVIMYNDLQAAGNQYNGSFRGVSDIFFEPGFCHVGIDVHKAGNPGVCGLSWLHPATLDACLHSLFPATIHTRKPNSVLMPASVEEISFSVECANRDLTADRIEVSCCTEKTANSNYAASLDVSLQGHGLISFTSLRVKELKARQAVTRETDFSQQCQMLVTCLDPILSDANQVQRLCLNQLKEPSPPRNIALLAKACTYFAKSALSKHQTSAVESKEQYKTQFFEWLQRLAATDRELDLSDTDSGTFIQEVISTGVEGEMVCRIGRNLMSILNGELEALALMMEGGLLHNLYRHDQGMQRCAIPAAEHIRHQGLKTPNMKILEIGAGTGGTTLPVLQALTPDQEHPLFERYTFTDISTGFFKTAEEAFLAWKPKMDFKALNIEIEPKEQGFEQATYDVVIAANVLHATTHIEKTMQNVRRLLKPGGRLYLLESMQPTVHRSFVFGTLPGWWTGALQRGKDHPLLSADEWNRTLRQAGFSGIDCLMDPHDLPEEQTDKVLVSTAIPQPATFSGSEKINLFLSSAQMSSTANPGYALAQTLLQSCSSISGNIFMLGDTPSESRICLCLAGLEDTFLATMDNATFESFRQTILYAREVIWLTCGASGNCSSPQSALANGLIRALRKENSRVRIFTLDLDPDTTDPEQAHARSLIHFIRYLDILRTGEDSEFIERGGIWSVPRLMDSEETTKATQGGSFPQTITSRERSISTDGASYRLMADGSGSLQNLKFVEEQLQNPIADDEVEIKVQATGINFRDSMILLGEMDDQLWGECSGVVRSVGKSFTEQFTPGDRVYTWLVPAHCSAVRAKGLLVHHIPASMTFEQAASLPIVYGTAFYCLSVVAQLQPGETVLIHAGAGGVGQAAVTFARHVGATIFATVSSEEKRKLLVEQYGIPPEHVFSSRTGDFRGGIKRLTKGVGVDVVLNCLAGAFMHDSLNTLAMFGRFVEIGKRDVLDGARMDMEVFDRNISMTFVDLIKLTKHQLEKMAGVFARVHRLVEAGVFQPPKPLKVFSVSSVEEAFRHFQGRAPGKTVLTFGKSDQVMVLETRAPISFASDTTYLVAGGQGGLGRSMCRWMAQHGAKNIVIFSPSGPKKQSTQELVQDLAAEGVQLQAFAVDISNTEQLNAVLELCKAELPPIRGVIQAALRLKDTAFENLTYEDHQRILAPKVAGTYALHSALPPESLDFFVILSSYAGLIGNAGQASYAGASTFQDAFARWRTAQGYPTRSLTLGPIEGAGYLADHPEGLESLKRGGLQPVSLDQFLALLGYATSEPVKDVVDSQIAIGWGSNQLAHTDPLFYHLRANRAASTRPSDAESKPNENHEVSVSELLATGTSPTLTADITSAMSRCVSGLTGVAVEDIDPAKSISVHGGDSLVVVEFRNWLRKTIDSNFGMGKDMGTMALRDIARLAVGYAKD